MLGGRLRDKVRAYAWIGGDRPHEIGEAAKARAAQGFSAVKMNATAELDWIGTPRLFDEVIARVEAAQAAGVDVGLDFHGRVHRPLAKQLAKALEPLRAQLKAQPKLKGGAYAHSKTAASQLWLEDSYALAPFLAELATANNDAAGYAEAVRYLATLERYLRNPKTGLLSQGFDEKHQEKWANPKSGVSAAPWGVTTGLYAAAVVDTLERLPAKHPGRGDLRNILVRLA
jgi:rhamnogalacturonyl hydrolase YesR